MTSPAGYARARTSSLRDIDLVWAGLRQATQPLSAAELAGAYLVSRTQVKRTLRVAREAGWVEVASVELRPTMGPGAAKVPLYRITATAPVVAPILRNDGGGWAPHWDDPRTTGADLCALRSARGWTLAETAAHIGVRSERTVQRYEQAKALPPVVAARIRELARPPVAESRSRPRRKAQSEVVAPISRRRREGVKSGDEKVPTPER